MRMVRCYACGKRYDYDDDGFCPKCGAFNQPARERRAAGARVRPRAGASARRLPGEKAGAGAICSGSWGSSLKQVEKAMDRLLKGSPPPRGRRLPGGDR